MNITRTVPVALLILILSPCLQAVRAVETDHAFGVSYSTGASDLFQEIELDVEWPIGFSYRPHWNFESGLRIDLGIGPAIVGWGRVSTPLFGIYDIYLDVPVSTTVGYNFARERGVNPYLRGGLVVHFIDAEFSGDSTAAGVVGAGGLEWRNRRDLKVFTEVTYDSSDFDINTGFGLPRTAKLRDVSMAIGLIAVF